MVSIPACHAGDPGSIPGLGDFFSSSQTEVWVTAGLGPATFFYAEPDVTEGLTTNKKKIIPETLVHLFLSCLSYLVLQLRLARLAPGSRLSRGC